VLTLRGSPTPRTNYNCGPSNTRNGLSIAKLSPLVHHLVSQSANINSGDIISFNVSGTA